MNGFDLALIAFVVLSTVFAYVRGVVRELIALATWIIGFVLAFQYAGEAAQLFSRLDVTPVVRHVLGFTLILIAVLIIGTLVATMLSGAVRAVGLGFVDRLVGAAFGVARGVAVVVLFALIAGVTALPKQDWWQNSALGRPLALAALALKPYLPRAWAERLDFRTAGLLSARLRAPGAGALLGKHASCVES